MRGPAAFPAVAMLAASLVLAPVITAGESAPSMSGAGAYPEGLVHVVEQGDTLWDLAGKYLGSPWSWQDLWERNRFLTNPHYIYPGIRIVVFPPPATEIALLSAEPSAQPPADAALRADAGARDARPAVGQKPRTLDITASELVRAGEFLREKPAGIGRIRGGEEPKVAFSEGDMVFLQLDKEIPEGQLLGVYRVRGPISARGDRPIHGYARYLVGLVQSAGKKDGEPSGIVRVSFEDLGREDILREEIPSYAPVVLSAGGGAVIAAYVIAGQWENTELAAGHFVFLDRGSASGVAVGDVFRLYDESSVLPGGYSDSGAGVYLEVAQAVVVRVTPEFSTAYISKSVQSFSAGGKAVRRGEAPK